MAIRLSVCDDPGDSPKKTTNLSAAAPTVAAAERLGKFVYRSRRTNYVVRFFRGTPLLLRVTLARWSQVYVGSDPQRVIIVRSFHVGYDIIIHAKNTPLYGHAHQRRSDV